MQFKPMLAVKHTGPLLHDDYLLSPKYDGIRCIVRDSFPMSRTMKVLPNKHIQQAIGDYSLENFDSEICVGHPYADDVYNVTSSGVMGRDGEPDFKMYVFDVVPDDLRMPYTERLEMLTERVKGLDPEFKQHVVLVPQLPIEDEAQMLLLEEKYLKLGYEGCIIRRASAPYKMNRSTLREGYLLKLKRMETSEALIVGMECMYHNSNEATKDELGHTKRSSHASGMVALDTMGKLNCKDVETGIEFDLGTGFTAEQRKEIWDNQDKFIGKICSYNHFPIGVKLRPRLPVWKGWRDKMDMS